MKNISALIALFLLLSVCGCKFGSIFSKSENPNNSGSDRTTGTSSGDNSTTSPGAIRPSGDALADLKAVIKRMKEVKAFQAVMNGTGKKDFHMEMGYASPNRYRMKNGPMETIIIGDDTYMNAGGTWRKFPVNMGSMIHNLQDYWTDEAMKSFHDVRFVGSDSVDGKSSLVYSYASSGHQGVHPYTSKLWLSRDTGLPQKFEIEYSEGELKTLKTTYTYNDDPIEPPIKN